MPGVSSRHTSQGMVLILLLWMLALASIWLIFISDHLGTYAKYQSQREQRLIWQTQARSLLHWAEEQIAHTRHWQPLTPVLETQLDVQQKQAYLPYDGRWRTHFDTYPELAQQGARVSILDLSGRINPNLMVAGQWRSLIQAWHQNESLATEVTAVWQDWRDPDHLKALNGAEFDDYQKLGYAPRNANLVYVDEMRLWKISRPWLPQGDLRQYFSVYAPENKVNPNYASVDLLAALPGMDASLARTLLQAREGIRPLTLNQVRDLVPITRWPSLFTWLNFEPSRRFLIEAVAHKDAGFSLYEVVELEWQGEQRRLATGIRWLHAQP
ncbi:Type II secretory pathway, component PulK [Allopseudospirillum japonicum]|uniref:Type II secretory pathway, component PulK n=1 Tax=Allopseudospirillum japonicum TaxID=64971 RepID=A0A1H6R546_9GAMM|nr:type II secretion system protein GspK [Allopseudospirillum japonicum]SEI46735.1 Type II secretory pathway, component PulK [Allopseudospirillum japonicum]